MQVYLNITRDSLIFVTISLHLNFICILLLCVTSFNPSTVPDLCLQFWIWKTFGPSSRLPLQS